MMSKNLCRSLACAFLVAVIAGLAPAVEAGQNGSGSQGGGGGEVSGGTGIGFQEMS